jgi:hypothetical protein
MWPRPRDSSIHADLSVDATAVRAVTRAAREAGHRVTVTAILAKVVGRMLVEHPDMNLDVRGGELRPRNANDVWVTMADDEGHLAGRRVNNLDERDLLGVQGRITAAGEVHRQGESLASTLVTRAVASLPLIVMRPLLRLFEFMLHSLRIPVPIFGISREGFGAVHITNVGPFGLRHVAAPIPPIAGQSFLLAVGEIHEAPVVREGEVEVGHVLPITATIDHRVVVGLRGGEWYDTFTELLTNVDHLLDLFDPETRQQVAEHLDEHVDASATPARSGGEDTWSL